MTGGRLALPTLALVLASGCAHELVYRPAGFDASIILFVIGIALLMALVRWK